MAEESDSSGGQPIQSEELANERMETKRKTFFLDLKKNDRGMFIKISERSGGRRSTVMIPYEYIDEFMQKIQILKAAGPVTSEVEGLMEVQEE